jgi:hypothetical protein
MDPSEIASPPDELDLTVKPGEVESTAGPSFNFEKP